MRAEATQTWLRSRSTAHIVSNYHRKTYFLEMQPKHHDLNMLLSWWPTIPSRMVAGADYPKLVGKLKWDVPKSSLESIHKFWNDPIIQTNQHANAQEHAQNGTPSVSAFPDCCLTPPSMNDKNYQTIQSMWPIHCINLQAAILIEKEWSVETQP